MKVRSCSSQKLNTQLHQIVLHYMGSSCQRHTFAGNSDNSCLSEFALCVKFTCKAQPKGTDLKMALFLSETTSTAPCGQLPRIKANQAVASFAGIGFKRRRCQLHRPRRPACLACSIYSLLTIEAFVVKTSVACATMSSTIFLAGSID